MTRDQCFRDIEKVLVPIHPVVFAITRGGCTGHGTCSLGLNANILPFVSFRSHGANINSNFTEQFRVNCICQQPDRTSQKMLNYGGANEPPPLWLKFGKDGPRAPAVKVHLRLLPRECFLQRWLQYFKIPRLCILFSNLPLCNIISRVNRLGNFSLFNSNPQSALFTFFHFARKWGVVSGGPQRGSQSC